MKESYLFLCVAIGFLLFLVIINLVGMTTDGDDITFSYADSVSGGAVADVEGERMFGQALAYLLMAMSLGIIVAAIVKAVYKRG